MVADGLNAVRERIAAAVDRVGRSPEEVTLVAVSKGRSEDEIMAAYEQGQRDFGENRAMEMASKVPNLPNDIRWHFIGSLQSRKAKLVGADTTLLHSLDRPKLARAWARTSSAPTLLQVNIAKEPQKHGALPEDVAGVLAAADEVEIAPVGLMIIPPLPETPEDSRRWFVALRTMRDELSMAHPNLVELSMGMTDDFEVAVEEGATLIRVGRAIFDPAA